MAPGFDSEFLTGFEIALPIVSAELQPDVAPTRSGDLVRHYTHYSLQMSAARRLCRWVAWNIDGANMHGEIGRADNFVEDPEYLPAVQIGNELYSNDPLDRGHIARRADLVWGSSEEAAQANIDSYFLTNITPQLEDFNRSSKHGLWGELENAVMAIVNGDHQRLSVLGGPILAADDVLFRDILVPRSFWKIVCTVEHGEPRGRAYVITQKDLEKELETIAPLDPFEIYQLRIVDLEAMIGLGFDPSLVHADAMPTPQTIEPIPGPVVRKVESRADLVA
jgi:endonuclease G, mitochondrial